MKKNIIRTNLTENIVFYNSAEVMDILQITRPTFARYLKSGKLSGVKVGGSWRFTEEDIRNFVDGLKKGSETLSQTKEE